MDELKDNLTCPLSCQIYYHPVTACDGHTYERDMIEKWLKQSMKSPITNEILDPERLNYSYSMKNMVDYHLELNPEWKKDQYKISEPFDKRKSEIYKCLKDKKFDQLLLVHDFDFRSSHREINFMKNLFENCQDKKVLDHVLGNTKKVYRDNLGYHVIHYLVMHCSLNFIQKCVGKYQYLDLEKKVKNSYEKPIHLAILKKKEDVVCWLIDKNVDLNAKRVGQLDQLYVEQSVISLAINNKMYRAVKKMVKKDSNILNEKTFYTGSKPIHQLCENLMNKENKRINSRASSLLFYMFEKGANLFETDKKKNTPICFIFKNLPYKEIENFLPKLEEYYKDTNTSSKKIKYVPCFSDLLYCPFCWCLKKDAPISFVKKIANSPIYMGQNSISCLMRPFINGYRKTNDYCDMLMNMNTEADFNSNESTYSGFYPIHYFIGFLDEEKCIEMIQFILEKYQIHINVQNNAGETPIVMAVGRKKMKVFEYLYQLGADLETVTHFNDSVHHRLSYDNSLSTELFKDLVAGERFDFYMERNDGISILERIIKTCDLDKLKHLFEKKINFNKPNSLGLYPIHSTADNFNSDIFKYFVNCENIDMNVKTPTNNSILAFLLMKYDYQKDKILYLLKNREKCGFNFDYYEHIEVYKNGEKKKYNVIKFMKKKKIGNIKIDISIQ